jgi:hypothetical protein
MRYRAPRLSDVGGRAGPVPCNHSTLVPIMPVLGRFTGGREHLAGELSAQRAASNIVLLSLKTALML